MNGPWTEDQADHLHLLIYNDLDLCGCGWPNAAIDRIRQLLNLAPFYDHRAELTAVFHGDLGLAHLVLSMLDRAGLTEHGTIIDGG